MSRGKGKMSGLTLLIVSMSVSLVRVSLGGNLGTMSFDNPTHLHSAPTNRGVSRLQSLRFPIYSAVRQWFKHRV